MAEEWGNVLGGGLYGNVLQGSQSEGLRVIGFLWFPKATRKLTLAVF